MAKFRDHELTPAPTSCPMAELCTSVGEVLRLTDEIIYDRPTLPKFNHPLLAAMAEQDARNMEDVNGMVADMGSSMLASTAEALPRGQRCEGCLLTQIDTIRALPPAEQPPIPPAPEPGA